MSEKKPQPLNAQKKRNLCPICGKVSYSLSGIHPQCLSRQEDLKRMERRKKEMTAEPTTKQSEPKHWQKTCPKCSNMLHVRNTRCECGYVFLKKVSARSKPA